MANKRFSIRRFSRLPIKLIQNQKFIEKINIVSITILKLIDLPVRTLL